jgi:lysophospholipase L1-like esterase
MKMTNPWLAGRRIGAFYPIALLLAFALTACSEPKPLHNLPTNARVLAFGDSLTHGTGAQAEESYPAVLAALIGREVIRSGLPGELSSDGLERLPGVLAEIRPNLVILCHAANDILRNRPHAEAAANLRAMIELTRASGAQVVLIGVPERGILLSTAPFYAEVAETTHTPLIDAELAEIIRRPALKSDQVHPNAAGYQRMAEAIARQLRELGAL